MQKSFNIISSTIYPLGVRFTAAGLHIALVCEDREECGLLLFDRHHKDGIKIPFPKEFRKGNIYSMLLKGYQNRNCSYLFYHGEKVYQDPYAKALENNRKYGETAKQPAHCKVLSESYDWEGDRNLAIPFEDSIFYMLHVRGFTKHRTSGVNHKGTYAGIVEKIPYLKYLGVTAILLMPTYEFDEVFHEDKRSISMEQAAANYKDKPIDSSSQGDAGVRINYWGYQEGLYLLPKYAYSYSKDAISEFKDMVKELHKNGIEVMMQFYLPPSLSYVKILEIIMHWIIEYHIDGFQLMGVDIPMQMLCKEPLLAETKLIGEKDYNFQMLSENTRISGYSGGNSEYSYCNFGYMNDAFLYDMRKLLKGDSDMIESFIYRCRDNAADKGIVNYIAKQDGFRLADLVTYNTKHNEANGEDNKDGISQNYSWNCGIEGKSRKKFILNLRMRQMKNALTFVMLSQGTPLIYSGDEFGNSQDGNNNPYCQDNPVCWIKWNMLKSNEELFNYTKELIALRKSHKILHMGTPLKGIDYKSCGYPDISFHGKDAWRPDTSQESRSIGILYCCKYGSSANKSEDSYGEIKAGDSAAPENIDDSYIYIGINMHWESRVFGLPQMPKGFEWVKAYTTETELRSKNEDNAATREAVQNIRIPARTIMIYKTQKSINNDIISNKSTIKEIKPTTKTSKKSISKSINKGNQ
ncbi:MAG: hypothetical protein J1D87_03185 [Lachnospiraceae bacterium]|nr:hypothetical protein [Lachnospiraceae bacterium]